MKKKRPPRPDSLVAPNHNEFFSGVYALEEVAIAHVAMVLSPEELAELDVRKATLMADSYVEEELKPSFSDVVWQCPLKNGGNPLKVAFLFEHKSSPPSYPIEIQLLQYFLGIWRREVANGQPPSLIVAIIVYHGARRWTTPSMEDVLKGVPLLFQKYVLRVHYIFTDVSRMPDSLIKTNEALGILRNVLLALKFAFDARQLKQNFTDIAIFAVSKREGPPNEIFLKMLCTHVQNCLDEVREMENLIETLPEEPRAVALSTYEKIIEKGRQEGIRQGIQQGIEQGIQREGEESTRRFVLNLIRETDLSDERIAQLAGAEVAYVAELRRKTTG